MNKKQLIVLLVMVLLIAAVFCLNPPYKLANLGGYTDNYIKTKIGSSLFKRCQAPLRFEWQKIIPPAAAVVIAGIFLIRLLRR